MPAQDAPPAIAAIGMAGRFPGAPTLDALWDNLRRGVESITHFPPEELEDAYGRSLQDRPGYVRARSILDGVELFVGPGRTLTSLAPQNEGARGAPLFAVSLPDPGEQRDAEAVFLDTLGRLWAAGVAPNWRALYEGAPERHVVLPTYPFQLKRYFMDPPSASPDKANTITAKPIAANPIKESSITAMANEIQQSAPNAGIVQQSETPNRLATIRADLAALLEKLSDIDVANTPRGTSFLEFGFDSLFLTQASQAIKTRFNVAVSFRQMMSELGTVDAVAEHLNQTAPEFTADIASAAPVPAEVVPLWLLRP